MIFSGLRLGLPVRLGVSYGPVVINQNEDIYIGKPIVDAYLTEGLQNWIGGACHSSCENGPYFYRTKEWGDVLYYDVPTKKGTTSMFALNWGRAAWKECYSLCNGYWESIKEPHIQEKYLHSISFLKDTEGIYTANGFELGITNGSTRTR